MECISADSRSYAAARIRDSSNDTGVMTATAMITIIRRAARLRKQLSSGTNEIAIVNATGVETRHAYGFWLITIVGSAGMMSAASGSAPAAIARWSGALRATANTVDALRMSGIHFHERAAHGTPQYHAITGMIPFTA